MPKTRELPPLPVAERRKAKRPEKHSMTLMSKWDTCHRSAFLYLKHKGGAQTHAMARGEVFHQFVEEAVGYLTDPDENPNAPETSMPPEVAKDRMMATIAERRDLVLPEFEQQALRGMAWNWAGSNQGLVEDPEAIMGREQMIELDLGDWIVRGKLDYALMSPFGYPVVDDYKTSLHKPSKDELENGAKSYQGKFYALLFLFGIPEGESLPLGHGLDECRTRQIFPRYLNEETGDLSGADFEVVYSRDFLSDFRRSLADQLAGMDQALKDGRWQAAIGSHCTECPAQAECPLPRHIVPKALDVSKTRAAQIGTLFEELAKPAPVETLEDAEHAATAAHILSMLGTRVRSRVRDFADENGHEAVFYGTDYKLAFKPKTAREVDWEALEAGEPFDPKKHVKVTESTEFTKRKITADEREARNGR